MRPITNEAELAGVALALGALEMGPLTAGESASAGAATRVPEALVKRCRDAIAGGSDPLGEAFCALRTPLQRRALGATYTPPPIVQAMTDWAAAREPGRVVDPGAGTGRFIVAAGRRFSRAKLCAVELDPLALLLLRAHLFSAGLARRATVVAGDYRELALRKIAAPTLFLGNPPYVRHHAIDPRWKRWLVQRAAALGLPASQLSGLHVHFFLATAALARAGDYGAFITAAEWLDVNYGSLVRQLFLSKLGGKSLHILEPALRPFADAETTAVISCFEVGTDFRSLRLKRVESLAALGSLGGGRTVVRQRLETAERWTPLTRGNRKARSGFVELGELCRVHRGQVTGANHVWIADEHASDLPLSVLFPSVTRARELFAAGDAIADASTLRRVIDLPVDLEGLAPDERSRVEGFLRRARRLGADLGFVARHRKAWWSVGLREPAPILATYMARRPPAFVRNIANVRHINIAHGLYPRERLSGRVLDALARYLASGTELRDGRTYAGGLTKFEPKEMERLLVPAPEVLAASTSS
jgi:hypothetical protein